MAFFFPRKFRKQTVSQPEEIFQISYNIYMSTMIMLTRLYIISDLSRTEWDRYVSLTNANVRNSIF